VTKGVAPFQVFEYLLVYMGFKLYSFWCTWLYVPRPNNNKIHQCSNLGQKSMMTGGLALPEPLYDEDGHLWFKKFEVCSAAIGWVEAK